MLDFLPAQWPANLSDWLILLWMVWRDLRSDYKERKALNMGQAPKPRPRFAWPRVLAAIIATAIAWGPIVLPYFGVFGAVHSQKYLAARPLADDALKWQLQEQLARDLRSEPIVTNRPIPTLCQVVIVPIKRHIRGILHMRSKP
jgi:hypothetical protein